MNTLSFADCVIKLFVIMNYENVIIVHLINVKIAHSNIGTTFLIHLIHSAAQSVLKRVIIKMKYK